MPAKKHRPADAPAIAENEPLVLEPIICVSTNLRMAARATTRLYDKSLAPVGLNVTQYAILNNIFKAGEIATMNLASRLCLERTTLYRALSILEKRSLIALRPGHGREQLLSLTQAGIELREIAFCEWSKVQKMFVEAFGEEWKDLLNQVRKVQKIVELQLGEELLD